MLLKWLSGLFDPKEGLFAVRYQSSLSIRELAQHVCICSTAFGLIVLEAVYGSAVNSLAAHVITSRFVLHVLTGLEYTIVVCGAISVMLPLGCEVLNRLKRFIR
jgi:hypothetical protein